MYVVATYSEGVRGSEVTRAYSVDCYATHVVFEGRVFPYCECAGELAALCYDALGIATAIELRDDNETLLAAVYGDKDDYTVEDFTEDEGE